MRSRIVLGWVGTLLLSSCATKPDASTPTVAPPATSPGPSKTEPPDDGRVAIAGHLRAHDGAPLRRAELTVRRNGFREAVATAVLDDQGQFEVEVPPGIYSISLAAVDHRVVRRRTVISDDLRVEGRLGTYARGEPGETMPIRAEYLDSAGKVLGPGPGTADRTTEGIYRLELPAKPEGATTLRYQLADPGGRTYNGPLAERYENDGGGDFWSVVDVTTKDALELDLRALPPPDQEPQLQWTGESPATAAVIDFQDRWFQTMSGIRRRMPVKDGKIMEMTDELLAEANALAAKAHAEVESAPDPTTRALLHGAYLAVFPMFVYGVDDTPELRAEMEQLIDEVSPTDPNLALLLNLDNNLFRTRRDADEPFLAKTDAWLERRAREHADPSTAIAALGTLIYAADARGDDARVDELYVLAIDERFEGTYDQQHLKKRYDPDRILRRGKPFPAFDFAPLHDGEPRITSTDRAGQLYLLEFWATWCGPCVAEMPKLHATYAAINGAKPGKGRGEAGMRRLRPAKRPKVEFVFVSLDGDPGTVDAFRKQHWSMPWTHAFVGHSGEAEAMARYGFSGVPTTVLIDESGTILELEKLRGDELQPTLERVLAERSKKGSP